MSKNVMCAERRNDDASCGNDFYAVRGGISMKNKTNFRCWVAKAFFLLSMFFGSFVQALNLADLKGTYDVLIPQYQHCSPVHGAIWWETGLIEKYYKFGNLWKKEIDVAVESTVKTKEAQVTKKVMVAEGDNTIKLIHRLFYEVAGSFGITELPKNLGYHFSTQIIGKIIGLIEMHGFIPSKNLKNNVKDIINNDDDLKKSLNKVVEDKKSIPDGENLNQVTYMYSHTTR